MVYFPIQKNDLLKSIDKFALFVFRIKAQTYIVSHDLVFALSSQLATTIISQHFLPCQNQTLNHI